MCHGLFEHLACTYPTLSLRATLTLFCSGRSWPFVRRKRRRSRRYLVPGRDPRSPRPLRWIRSHGLRRTSAQPGEIHRRIVIKYKRNFLKVFHPNKKSTYLFFVVRYSLKVVESQNTRDVIETVFLLNQKIEIFFIWRRQTKLWYCSSSLERCFHRSDWNSFSFPWAWVKLSFSCLP